MFRYVPIKQRLFSPEIGSYQSFGLAAFQRSGLWWRKVAFLPDVSTSKPFVEQLARRYTHSQLHPIHLKEAVLNDL